MIDRRIVKTIIDSHAPIRMLNFRNNRKKHPPRKFFAIIPKVEHSYGCMTVNDCLNNPAVNHCKEISCVMGSSVFGVCVESGVELDCGKADCKDRSEEHTSEL